MNARSTNGLALIGWINRARTGDSYKEESLLEDHFKARSGSTLEAIIQISGGAIPRFSFPSSPGESYTDILKSICPSLSLVDLDSRVRWTMRRFRLASMLLR